jgi:thiol-disulfide isomerase/thioredoxin
VYWRQVLAQALTTKKNPLADQPVPMFAGVEPSQSFSGYEPKKLFKRSAGGRFDECSFVEGFESRLDGRSLVSIDLDRDGDLDLIMTNRNSPRLQLFENVGATGQAVELELVSTKGHREADGALVQVAGLGAFPVLLNRGYSSSIDPVVHVGLGENKTAKVQVRWRSGVTEDFGSVPAGSRMVLKEGSGKAEAKSAFAAPKVKAPMPFPSKVSDLPVKAGERFTVVQLFMQSCKPCREEVPTLNALTKKKGVNVVGLGLHTEQELPAVKKALKMTYEVAALPESVGAAFESQGGLALPTVLIYGKDGALLRVLAGGAQVGAVLAELGLPK